jgi:hypothetical protein
LKPFLAETGSGGYKKTSKGFDRLNNRLFYWNTPKPIAAQGIWRIGSLDGCDAAAGGQGQLDPGDRAQS